MHWAIKMKIYWYLIWQIFIIRQTTKINSMPNFHLIWYYLIVKSIWFKTKSYVMVAVLTSDILLEEDDVVAGTENLDEKRAITYQISRNKGLTPKRKKEQRNPRVKHRKKFRKAIIRRRSQVHKKTKCFDTKISVAI